MTELAFANSLLIHPHLHWIYNIIINISRVLMKWQGWHLVMSFSKITELTFASLQLIHSQLHLIYKIITNIWDNRMTWQSWLSSCDIFFENDRAADFREFATDTLSTLCITWHPRKHLRVLWMQEQIWRLIMSFFTTTELTFASLLQYTTLSKTSQSTEMTELTSCDVFYQISKMMHCQLYLQYEIRTNVVEYWMK